MNTATTNINEMRERIEAIEKLALELRELGAALPVIDKNMQIVLSVVRNLKFGIVDPAMLMDR